MSSSFNKNLLVAGFTTLALLIIVASHGVTAVFESRTGIMCSSLEMCVPICLQRGFTGGYCSTEHVVGDPSCVCTKPFAAQSTTAAAPAEKMPAASEGDAAGGRMGTAN